MSSGTKMRFATVLVLLLWGSFAFAHSGATGIVKERMDVMKDIGAQMKIVSRMIRGQRAFDKAAAMKAAETIAAHAQEIPALFPENSTDHPSEALPAIWSDWDKFIALSEAMNRNAMALAGAAESATDAAGLRKKFSEIRRNCSACHEQFRKAE